VTLEKARHLNTWLELDSAAFSHNLKFFKSILDASTEFVAVVKANAYGHGIAEMSQLALQNGVDALGVHSLEEAASLRSLSRDTRILLLGPMPPYRSADVVELDLEAVVSTSQALQALADAAKKKKITCNVHIKLETGTHRQGIDAAGLAEFLEIIDQSPFLRIAGVCTHFANIEVFR